MCLLLQIHLFSYIQSETITRQNSKNVKEKYNLDSVYIFFLSFRRSVQYNLIVYQQDLRKKMKNVMKIVFVLSIIMSILLTPSVAKGVSGGSKASTASGRTGTPTTTWTTVPRRPRTTTNSSSSAASSIGWSSSMAMVGASLTYLTLVYI